MNRPKVLLVDDHGVVIDGLIRILEPEFEIAARAADGRQMLEMAVEYKPQVIVADIAMPLLNGLDALVQLRNSGSHAKVVFLTAYEDVGIATQAFRLGASGYVLKHSYSDELLLAMREALHGQTYITPRIANGVRQMLLSGKDADGGLELSVREREVLQLVAEGKAMKEIAAILAISPRTVEFHKRNISEKTGLHSTAELARFAASQGLVGNPN